MDTTITSTVGEEAQRAVDALTNLAVHDSEERGRFDFADLTARILACTAANLGSVEALLATVGPGSHAGHVRALIAAVVPPAGIITQRTRDVVLRLDVAATFRATGITGRFEADARAVRHDIEREIDVFASHELGELLACMKALYEADQAALISAYADAARAHLRTTGLPGSVSVTIATEPAGPDAAPVWDDLAAEAHAAASAATAGLVEHLATGPGYRTQAMRVLSGLPATTTRTEVA